MYAMKRMILVKIYPNNFCIKNPETSSGFDLSFIVESCLIKIQPAGTKQL